MDNYKIHPLLNQFKKGIESHPDRIAVIDKNENNVTYADLSKKISNCREILKKKGVQKGSRVLVAIPMSIELYVILLALLSLGGIAVFLDPWLKGKQMSRIIKSVNPDLLLISSKLRWLAYLMPACWKIKNWWTVKTIKGSDQQWSTTEVDENDIALITFTGGTGGNPKGADRSFGFLSAQLKALHPHLKGNCAYKDFTNFPIVGLADLAIGNTVVVPNVNLMKIHKAKTAKIAKTLFQTKANRLIVSPSLLNKCIDSIIEYRTSYYLRHVITGGAPISYTLIERCLNQFPSLNFEAIFGSTEAEPMAFTNFEVMLKKMRDPLKGAYVGEIVKEVELKIIEPRRGPVCKKIFKTSSRNGAVGELIVSGEHVNKNYFENEKAFIENKIVDKNNKIWHRTGDIGYFSNGGLYLVGRLSRVMKHRSKTLHPYPIEFHLCRKLGLNDVGYIQTNQKQFVLVIGGKTTVSENEIRSACREAGYPLDKVYFFSKNLPRDPRHRSKLDARRLLHQVS